MSHDNDNVEEVCGLLGEPFESFSEGIWLQMSDVGRLGECLLNVPSSNTKVT